MKFLSSLAVLAVAAMGATSAQAEPTKLAIGISGWTGFAPLTLADKAGIFKAHGLDVDVKMIPQKDRHLAVASKAVQCAATTVETYISWNAAGVPIVQILQMDKSHGADGLAVRNSIKGFADLKGKTIAVDAPGTSPYFELAYMLKKNGMTLKDVRLVTMSPQTAAQSFVAGRYDAAMTYEPYLSTVRKASDKGRVLATTVEYPMIMDTLGCSPDWLKANPKAARALVESYFSALDMIKKAPAKSYEIMGAQVKQSGKEFAESAAYLHWADRAENKKFFSGEIQTFNKEAADILMGAGVLRKVPDLNKLYDASYLN